MNNCHIKNLVMSLAYDENKKVIGVEGMFMVWLADIGTLPDNLQVAANALLEHAVVPRHNGDT